MACSRLEPMCFPHSRANVFSCLVS